MAGMGKTGTVNIFPEMMDEAIKAIKDYRTIAFGDTDGNGSDGLYGTCLLYTSPSPRDRG